MLFWWGKRLASENMEEAREGFLFVASVGTETKKWCRVVSFCHPSRSGREKRNAGAFSSVAQVGDDRKKAPSV